MRITKLETTRIVKRKFATLRFQIIVNFAVCHSLHSRNYKCSKCKKICRNGCNHHSCLNKHILHLFVSLVVISVSTAMSSELFNQPIVEFFKRDFLFNSVKTIMRTRRNPFKFNNLVSRLNLCTQIMTKIKNDCDFFLFMYFTGIFYVLNRNFFTNTYNLRNNNGIF